MLEINRYETKPDKSFSQPGCMFGKSLTMKTQRRVTASRKRGWAPGQSGWADRSQTNWMGREVGGEGICWKNGTWRSSDKLPRWCWRVGKWPGQGEPGFRRYFGGIWHAHWSVHGQLGGVCITIGFVNGSCGIICASELRIEKCPLRHCTLIFTAQSLFG